MVRRLALACAVAVLVAALGGCARYYWSRPGGTLDDFDRDHSECARATSANPTEAALGIVDSKRYRACLQGRGWMRREEMDPPPAGSFRGFE